MAWTSAILPPPTPPDHIVVGRSGLCNRCSTVLHIHTYTITVYILTVLLTLESPRQQGKASLWQHFHRPPEAWNIHGGVSGSGAQVKKIKKTTVAERQLGEPTWAAWCIQIAVSPGLLCKRWTCKKQPFKLRQHFQHARTFHLGAGVSTRIIG